MLPAGTKHWTKSRTIWAAIVSSIVLVGMFIANPKAADIQYFVATGLLSNVGVIWGRLVASHKLRGKNG